MRTLDIENDGTLIKGSLSNGLNYYIFNSRTNEKKIKIALVIKVGSLMENNDEIGVSHFTEHFCIYNTKNCGYILNEKEQIIGMLRGYTKFEETVYLIESEAKALINNLDNIKSILLGKNFSKNGIKNVKSELVNEINRVTKKNEYRLKKNILQQISNIGNRMPIGKIENIDKFDYDSVIKYHKKWYKPKYSSIFIVGNIGECNLQQLIKDKFSQISNGILDETKVTFNEIKKISSREVTINVFDDLKEDEIQFYYLKPKLSYNTKQDFCKKIKEYFELNFIEQYICNEFKNSAMDYNKIDFISQRLISNLNYNVLQIKTNSNINEKLQLTIRVIQKLILDGIKQEKFDLYRSGFLKNLKYQYINFKLADSELLMQECIDNYLYNEPITSLKYEYDASISIIKNISLSDFNIEVKNILKKEQPLIVINCRNNPCIDTEHINNFWKLFKV